MYTQTFPSFWAIWSANGQFNNNLLKTRFNLLNTRPINNRQLGFSKLILCGQRAVRGLARVCNIIITRRNHAREDKKKTYRSLWKKKCEYYIHTVRRRRRRRRNVNRPNNSWFGSGAAFWRPLVKRSRTFGRRCVCVDAGFTLGRSWASRKTTRARNVVSQGPTRPQLET